MYKRIDWGVAAAVVERTIGAWKRRGAGKEP
jgi:hypothetical protein